MLPSVAGVLGLEIGSGDAAIVDMSLLPSVAGVLGLEIGSGDAAIVDMSFELTTGHVSLTVHVHVCVKGVCVCYELVWCDCVYMMCVYTCMYVCWKLLSSRLVPIMLA